MSVLTRGSQYRVESMLCRLARAQGFVMPSPDKSQVASQPALQSLPLILEPEGRFYTSPVIVRSVPLISSRTLNSLLRS